MKNTVEKTNQKFRYVAFIAYKHGGEDEKVAKQLHRDLQNYGLPGKLAKKKHCHKRLSPIFIDTEFLPGEEYEEADNDYLERSRFLIVICSKALVNNPTEVTKEVERFLSFGDEKTPEANERTQAKKIIAVTLCGEESYLDTYPEKLKDLKKKYDNFSEPFPLNKDKNAKKTREDTFLAIIAKMHGIEVAELKLLEHKRRRKRILISSVISTIVALALIFSAFWASQRSEIKHNIEDARILSETDTYHALDAIMEVEKKQNNWLFKNDDVYSTMLFISKYDFGQCLRQEKLDCRNIVSAEQSNKAGNLLDIVGVGSNVHEVIDMNDFRPVYKISPNEIHYSKGKQDYLMLLDTQNLSNPFINRIWIDDEQQLVYTYVFEQNGSENTDKYTELTVIADVNNNTSKQSKIKTYKIDKNHFDNIEVYLEGNTIFVKNKNLKKSVALIHKNTVVNYSVREDGNVLWSVDKDGIAYAWALNTSNIYIDAMTDNRDASVSWCITPDGSLVKLKTNKQTVTPILSFEEISFVGQTKESVYFALKNENMKYPVLCCCNKNTNIMTQVDVLQENGVEYHKSTLKPANLTEEQCRLLAQNTMSEIKEGTLLSKEDATLLLRNNSVEINENISENALPYIELECESVNSVGNPKKFTAKEINQVGSREILTVRTGHPMGVYKIECFVDDDKAKTVERNATTEMTEPLLIPAFAKDGTEHILFVKVFCNNGMTFLCSYRIKVDPENIPIPKIQVINDGQYMNEFSVTENHSKSIKINASTNDLAPILATYYVYDNDPELYSFQGGVGTISVLDRYLDGKEHTLLVQVETKYGFSRWEQYPFVYKQ